MPGTIEEDREKHRERKTERERERECGRERKQFLEPWIVEHRKIKPKNLS